MLLMTLATLGGTIYLYMIVPKGFFPQEDTVSSSRHGSRDDTSFEAMKVRQQALVDALKSDLRSTTSTAQSVPAAPNPTANYGRLFIALKPQKQRDGAGRRDRTLAAEGHPDSRHAGLLPEAFRT